MEAWEYALAQFDRFGLDGVERAQADAAKCLRWMVERLLRRRLKPETARRVLQRIPDWVWQDGHDDLYGALYAEVYLTVT